MEYLVKRSAITSEKSACAILPIFANKRLSEDTKGVDKLYKGLIATAVKNGDISGNAGETLLIPTPAGSAHKRLLLVGCGKSTQIDIIKYRKIINAVAQKLKSTGTTGAVSVLASLDVADQTARSLARTQVMVFEDVF